MQENGGIYKNETLKISTSSTTNSEGNSNARASNRSSASNITEGTLEWTKLKRYEVEGVKYVSIPFRFKIDGNFTNTLISGNVAPAQFKLVIRETKNNGFEAALQCKMFYTPVRYSSETKHQILEIYSDVNGNWINTWLYNKNEPIRVYKTVSGNSVTSSTNRTSTCNTFRTTSYGTECYGTSGGGEYDNTCYSVRYENWYSYCSNENDSASDFPAGGGETGGSGGGGGGEPANNDDYDGIAEAKSINDNIDDPCLKETYNIVSNQNLKNNITNILYNTFGATTDFNINFVDFNLNNDALDGHTRASIYSNGRMDFEVQLNTGVLPNASKEFTGVTIYHEILHAYLRTTGMKEKLDHHNEMANEYATKLSNALITAFPELDPIDAKSLVWGGLDETSAYDSIKVNHPDEWDNLRVRNSKHRIAEKGIPCN